MKQYIIYAFILSAALASTSCRRSVAPDSPEEIAKQYTFADTAILQVARADAEVLIAKDPNDPTLEGDLLAIRAKEEHIRQAGLTNTADLYIAAVEKHVANHSPQLAAAMGL